MTYFSEFRLNWRYLTAAFVGMGSGYTINNYLNNIFIPPLMAEFGWERSNIALIGATATLSIVFQPIAGRLTDRFGVRPMAIFGIAMAAVIYVLLSMMTGPFWIFLLLMMLQIALVASTTGAVVYSRLIAQRFSRARGLALATAVSAPSIAGALVVPILTEFIDDHGWRAGYLMAAGVTFLFGCLAVLLVPPVTPKTAERMPADREPSALGPIARSRPFQLILIGMVLCSLSISLQTTQLKVVVLDLGLSSTDASWLISLYAIGVIAGRFLSGAALDAFPTHVVAAVAMSLPGAGLLLLASGTSSIPMLILAMVLLGVSLGAEGDIAGYLVMRYFPVEVYSTVLGFVIGAIALASGVGGLILSVMLTGASGFTPFLIFSGIAALVGGVSFANLRKAPAFRQMSPAS